VFDVLVGCERFQQTSASAVVLVLVSGVLDSAIGFISDHFDEVVVSQAFLNHGKVGRQTEHDIFI
jgi:hypothetical protein